MTKKELIERLNEFPDDKEIVIRVETYNTSSTWDSQAFAREMHKVNSFCLFFDKQENEIAIELMETIDV